MAVRALCFILETFCLAKMLRHRKQMNRRVVRILVLIYLLTVGTFVVVSVYNYLFYLAAEDNALQYSLLPYKALLNFPGSSSLAFVSVTLAFLYIRMLRHIIRPSTFKRVLRVMKITSGIILVLTLLLGATTHWYYLDVRKLGLDDFSIYVEAGTFHAMINFYNIRFQVLNVVAIFQLLVVIVSLKRSLRTLRKMTADSAEAPCDIPYEYSSEGETDGCEHCMPSTCGKRGVDRERESPQWPTGNRNPPVMLESEVHMSPDGEPSLALSLATPPSDAHLGGAFPSPSEAMIGGAFPSPSEAMVGAEGRDTFPAQVQQQHSVNESVEEESDGEGEDDTPPSRRPPPSPCQGTTQGGMGVGQQHMETEEGEREWGEGGWGADVAAAWMQREGSYSDRGKMLREESVTRMHLGVVTHEGVNMGAQTERGGQTERGREDVVIDVPEVQTKHQSGERRLTKLDVLPYAYAVYCTAYIVLLTLLRTGTASDNAYLLRIYVYLLPFQYLLEGLCVSVIIYPFGEREGEGMLSARG
ncbi:hypothetical protein KIPB_008470 [Kipferlia bialata]|uniref:Uncharacterized protein n=1 Tax=Kipferlia bialata TaxID=797122 RepID=A0A9K3D2V3_9EUKA|nr:hypothetical protein KIPB_008470 [Kipferlia bialata]|eukprot:g8470.t1